MGVVIAGPGRSGTSLLVKILTECGFTTSSSEWFPEAMAGLESCVREGGRSEVFKDPWLFEYAEGLEPRVVSSIDVIVVPVRGRDQAVASRLVQDRAARLERSADPQGQWRWRTGGLGIPGGVVTGASAHHVSAALAEGLWDLLEWSLRNRIPLKLMHFPMFVQDFDYFWSSLGEIVEWECDREHAFRAWSSIVNPSSVRIAKQTLEPFEHLTKLELVGLLARLQESLEQERSRSAEIAADAQQGNDYSQELQTQLTQLLTSVEF